MGTLPSRLRNTWQAHCSQPKGFGHVIGKPDPVSSFFFCGEMIVPTLCVGTHPVTLRVTVAHGSCHASSAERGSSPAAFPRRAWERSDPGQTCNQVDCQAASLWLLIFSYLISPLRSH